MVATAQRLPGITFETRNPPVTTPLPRMDIAGFVGFARSGPIDVPVAVEDIQRFHDVFGEDAALAVDPDAGGIVYAELPPAVRAFFRNGGARCWVVRVAGRDAIANRFLIPGLLTAPADGSGVGGALAIARSAGSWSDPLVVNATIDQRPLAVSTVSPPGGAPFRLDGLSPGDLIQIEYPAHRIVAFQAVPGSDRRPPLTADIPDPTAIWFRRASREDVDAFPGSPPVGIAWLPGPAGVRWLAGAVPPDVDPDLPIIRWGVRDSGFIVELDGADVAAIQAGSWLLFTPAAAPPGARPALLLLVDGVAAAHPDSPPTTGDPVWLTAASAWWMLDGTAAALAVAGEAPRASVVVMELWALDPDEPLRRLPDLGLAAPHPLYWGDVPDDDLVFRRDDRRPTRLEQISPLLLDRVVIPRFPLAAPRPRSEKPPPIFLPLGLTALAEPERYQAALPMSADPLTRDGLASFDASLFVDPELARTTSANLMTEAFQVQYVDPAPGSPRASGRDLTGMHALAPIDEVSMIAVPDAVQRAWSPEPSETLPLQAPTLITVSAGVKTVHIDWTALSPALLLEAEQLSYLLQASPAPRFDSVAKSWPTATLSVDHPVDLFRFCTAPVFYRVRAISSIRGAGPWSNTRWTSIPPSSFEQCPDNQPAAPAPIAAAESRGRLVVAWTWAWSAGADFTVERASDPAFVSAAVVYTGTDTTFEMLSGAEPVVYFRVTAAVDGRSGPWSATAVVGSLQREGFIADRAVEYDDRTLLTVDEALIRLCAGRGDAHAVLSLPAHFREDAASAFVGRLSLGLERSDGIRVMSYAALFHPWLLVRETAGRPDLSTWAIPPDGPVCGTIAARTLRQGAWYSTANQRFEGALALQPALDSATGALLALRVNPLVQQPRGFVAIDARTLYDSDELGDLHVRRLLILLRRLAIREGNAFVFRNNDDSLRRLVQREFEQVLGDLFVRGAFAGTSHDEGYLVVTESSVNTPQSIDQGRFIAELRVAPSQPLTFLTVRLIQEGGALLVEEG